MSGPLPKDESQRRRRNPTPGFRQLLSNAREGKPTPPWPQQIGGTPSVEQIMLWEKMWSLPQAEEWERMHCEELVALYCLVQAEVFVTTNGSYDTKLISEMRQLDMKLGVSPGAMAGLRWEIADPPTDTSNTAQTNGKKTDRPVFVT